VFYIFFIYQTTFALNFRLNSSTSLEFAQGVTTTAPCTGDSEITVTPRSTFVNANDGGGTYYLSSVQIAGIPAACRGKNFDISFYDSATGSSALPIYSANGANMRVATVYSTQTANIFAPGFQSSGIAVSSASGAFTVTFKTPIALATDVKKVTLQSIAGKEGAEAISSSVSTTCILLTSSQTKCWGEGSSGELGSQSAVDTHTPVSFPNLGAGVVEIAVGGNHACALLSAGTVKCWGSDGLGQLGNGAATASNPAPTNVSNLSGVTAIAAGHNHTCALVNTGEVKCWGRNNEGAVGSAGNPVTSPATVSGLSGVSAITAGKYHSCALLNTGAVKCWGYNSAGQLGNGNNTGGQTPVDVSGLSSVSKISAGAETTCAVLSSGGARCWGLNNYGTLGNGQFSGNSNVPVTVSLMTTAAEISVGTAHACAVLRSGQVQCWGYNTNGQVGGGANRSSPGDVSGSGSAFKIAAGDKHTCAVLRTGGAQCWGINNSGQLGNGTFTNSSSPVSVTRIP
jgi:alpha-tubulin suppressor-like RCC1 family protein